MRLRNAMLQSSGCTFDTVVTADYGDEVYSFTIHCQTDQTGALTFTVTEPESITGITGTVDEIGGKLTFDDRALAFPTLADGQITPVSAPWLLIHSMRSGYIKACEDKNDGTHIVIDDSYRQGTVQIELYCDSSNIPIRGEIIWDGRRIVTMDVTNFTFL